MLLVYYDFPLTSIHPQAMAASVAGRCAGDQSAAAFWTMHDVLLENAQDWSISNPTPVFISYAEASNLDVAAFTACLENNDFEEAIQADIDLAISQGLRSTPSFLLNGQPLIGAHPLATFEEAIATIQEGGEYAVAEPTTPPRIVPTPATIVTDNAAITYGDAAAPVTIIEYTDYQCPYCARHAMQTMPGILNEMVASGDVYYIIKDFPIDQLHPDARAAAAAARCAGEQNFYPEMHDALFVEQGEWSGLGAATNGYFTTLAESLGMDGSAFDNCLASGRYDEVIQESVDEGVALGINGTPHFFINGYPVGGAQPYDLFAYAVNLAANGRLAEAYSDNPPPPEATPRPSGPVDIPEGDAFVVGNPDAPVTIVEYTDFQCPYCGRYFAETLPQIWENYVDTGIVRYVFKDFPLTSIHPQAVVAAEAARCAGAQEAFLEMHDALFSNQSQWSGRSDAADLFVGYATELGLDGDAFQSCLESNEFETAVLADLQEGMSFGVQGTPSFFLNGYFLSGAQPYAVFEQAIEQLQSQATGE